VLSSGKQRALYPVNDGIILAVAGPMVHIKGTGMGDRKRVVFPDILQSNLF
jgi:hypothetical protein